MQAGRASLKKWKLIKWIARLLFATHGCAVRSSESAIVVVLMLRCSVRLSSSEIWPSFDLNQFLN